MKAKKNLLSALGPGILFACTAIGVSHLVQSTRAGADFGFGLLWVVVLANVLKYPFFEYGSRYANIKGESIIDGYTKIGNWLLWTYTFISIISMLFVSAAVGFTTAGFLDHLFQINQPLVSTLLVFGACLAILYIGRYQLLDQMLKIAGGVLVITTIIAFVIALIHGPATTEHIPSFVQIDAGNLAFIIALMGWMPTAVDLSTWNSLWTVEKIKSTGYHPPLKQTLADFNIGYWVSAVLSLCFITLGAYLVYGTNAEMPAQSHAFAARVIELYTKTIGDWSYLIMAVVGFTVMFSTSIGVFDGYARALTRCTQLIKKEGLSQKKGYNFWLAMCALGALFIIFFYLENLLLLVKVATTLSFVIAPLIAIVNFRLVLQLPKNNGQPPLLMKVLSYLGILFLTGFSLVYLIYLAGGL